MDNVLVDFQSGIDKINQETRLLFEDRMDEVPGIFSLMKPMPYSVEVFKGLTTIYDLYFLSTAPWNNPSAWTDKLNWVKQYLGESAHKRLILTHHKNLNKGHYLIDDRGNNGADEFEGELIEFGSAQFKNWMAVRDYLIPQEKLV